ncbi:unnamed protein product [Blepharisma stoltei]|uniref:Uncharacterized protein n=1 Tax=Blepharisma stoltei TaxID=1481888 RepID=A0AAU9JHK1_9CILI|nr:unnamed protein product [Blepharisma stoltei]
MEDEYKNDDEIPCTEGFFSSIWNYAFYWMIRPSFRGIIFGLGLFFALKVCCPYLCNRYKISYNLQSTLTKDI